MAVKYFCDCCNREMTKIDQDRLQKRKDGFKIIITHGMNNVWNNGHLCHLCHMCVLDIAAHGKYIFGDVLDRPEGE